MARWYRRESSDVYDERYLYDLTCDPHKQVNLVGRPDFWTVADDLRNRLEAYIQEVEDELPRIKPYENGYNGF